MWSGDHLDIVVTVSDSTSASKDLTGGSVVWHLSETPTSASLIRRSTDSGCGVSLSGCTFTVSLSPVHTAALAGIYYHEAQVRDSGSNTATVMTGYAKIHKDAI